MSTLASYDDSQGAALSTESGGHARPAPAEEIAKRYALVRRDGDHPARHEVTIRRVYECLLEPGDAAIDGGAHSGKHTLPMSSAVGASGKVLACEPLEEARDALVSSLGASGVTNVDVCPTALWSVGGRQFDFLFFPERPGVSGFRRRTDSAELKADVRTVNTVTVDELAGGLNVHFIKLDVEGAEYFALLGAENTVNRCRPTIHVEGGDVSWAAYGVDGRDLLDWCDDHGYLCFDAIGTRLSTAEAVIASFQTPGVWDYFLVDALSPDRSKLSVVLASAATSFGLGSPGDGLAARSSEPGPPIFHYRMVDYDRRLLPNSFVAELDRDVTSSEDWIAKSGLSLGYPGWGLLYYIMPTLLDPDRPNLVVETGTNLGSTSILIAQAIIDSGREVEFHTIEIDRNCFDEAKRRFDAAGVSAMIVAHCGDALAVLPEIVDSASEISVAFLDGKHSHDHVLREFEHVASRLRTDGAIVLDNTYAIGGSGPDPRVNGAIRTIQSRYGGNVVNFPFCSWYTPGMAIWQPAPFSDMTPPQRGTW